MPDEKKETALKPPFTLRVRKSRENEEYIEMGLKELDEPTFLAANNYIRKDKELDAVKFLINNLRISGAEASEITGNFIALRASVGPLMELIRPLDGELKKN